MVSIRGAVLGVRMSVGVAPFELYWLDHLDCDGCIGIDDWVDCIVPGAERWMEMRDFVLRSFLSSFLGRH